jgi:general L-amino acid transport system substrate-binding protein
MINCSGRPTWPIRAFAFSLGILAGAVPAWSGTLDDIRSRGVVTCGVSEGIPGFSLRGEDGSWSGLDVDFCRALASAVLGDATKVALVPTTSEERFSALSKGTIDVLTRNTSWTFQREIEHGVVFPGVLYFDGQGVMVPKELGLTTVAQLAGGKICVLDQTTSQSNAAAYFAKAGLDVELVTFAHRKDALAAYEAGQCDARSADRSALFGERQLLSDPSRHMILAETFSKEPLGPAVGAGDPLWAGVVRWVLFSLLAGEELEVTQAALQAKPAAQLTPEQSRFIVESGQLGAKFGLAPTWVATVIRNVGNYGEMFDRNLGKASQIGMVRGANALWKDGGLLYAPPMP